MKIEIQPIFCKMLHKLMLLDKIRIIMIVFVFQFIAQITFGQIAYPETLIEQRLTKKLNSIGDEMIQQMKKGNLPFYFYRNDSLILWEIAAKDVNDSYKVEGFLIIYNISSKPEDLTQNMTMSTIGPMANLVESGAELGLYARYHARPKDISKCLSEDNYKILISLANLLYPTTIYDTDSFDMEFEMFDLNYENLFYKINKNTIINKITDRKINYLSAVLNDRIINYINNYSYIQNYRQQGDQNGNIEIYKDIELKSQCSLNELDTMLVSHYPTKTLDPKDNSNLIDTIIHLRIDFTSFKVSTFNSEVIGLTYNGENNRTVKCYMKMNTFMGLTKEPWESYLFKQLM